MKKLTAFVFMLTMFSTGTATAEETSARYYVPPSQFNAALEVMDLGFANVFGLFHNATGSFEFDSAAKSVSNLKFAIDATSLMANNPENTSDLMVLLGTTQYPEIVFTTKDGATFADGKANLKGTLTLHGVSKPTELEATLNHIGKSPKGGGMWSSEGEAIGLSLRGTFKRADFGMTDDPNVQGRFGDTVTLRMETQAIRQ